MSHEITLRTDGKAEMAYVGERPWHGLGQKLEAGRSIDEWQHAAGMDWQIGRSRVRFGEGKNQQVWDDKIVLFRRDTKAPLGLVSDGYKVVQPREILEFFRDLVGDNGFELETAGTLFGGKQFWALARIGDDAVFAGDLMKGFLLLSTSCDGSMNTTAKVTTVRVVCNNTLTAAIAHRKSGDNVIAISHRSAFQPDTVKRRLGIARDTFRQFILETRKLAETPIGPEARENFIEELLVDTKTVTAGLPRETKTFRVIADLVAGLAKGSTLPGVNGTLWGLVNGVSEYVDHHARARSTSHQLSNAWFGRGDMLKTAAMDKALVLAG